MGERNYERNGTLEKFNDLLQILESIKKNIYYDQDILQCFINEKNYSKELYNHSVNVAFLSLVIGKNYYKNETELTELFIAALLHDYGKIFIPKYILEKPDILTKDERKILELHSIIGYSYLKQQTNLKDNVLNAVLDHHEKADGSGYGLCKKSIDISNYAKIIAIADVYDAMVSDRVYRKRMSQDIVNEYLHSNAGNHFDLAFTEQFLNQIDILTEETDLECMEQEFKSKLKLFHR